jgi:voltage-gated potassium channel
MGSRMSTKKEIRVVDWVSFLTFLRLFIRYCFILRGLLVAQAALVILLGAVFAWCERLPVGQGIYFAMITSTTVGFGDIAPKTGLGQCTAVLIAYVGIILFGLVIAVATKAFTVTIEEHLRALGDAGPTS